MAAAANGSTSALRADAATRRWAVLGVCQGRGGTTWGSVGGWQERAGRWSAPRAISAAWDRWHAELAAVRAAIGRPVAL